MGKYTLKYLYYRLQSRIEERKEEVERQRDNWMRDRWSAYIKAKIAGVKVYSVYDIARFPWESPSPAPEQDILSMLPDKLI